VNWLYQFFLGPRQPIWVSDLSNLTVFTVPPSMAAFYWHHTCTERWCFRLGHHPVEGTTFKTCRPHAKAEIHDRLFAEHAAKHPEQHELLNRKGQSQ
jgi:hypothetical protein